MYSFPTYTYTKGGADTGISKCMIKRKENLQKYNSKFANNIEMHMLKEKIFLVQTL